MLFVGTSIIHPSTEGVFLLCNILDLLIYSKEIKDTKTSPEVAVENKTGAQLPSTGSKGALMVTLAGIVLFGVLTASKAFGKKKAKN